MFRQGAIRYCSSDTTIQRVSSCFRIHGASSGETRASVTFHTMSLLRRALRAGHSYLEEARSGRNRNPEPQHRSWGIQDFAGEVTHGHEIMGPGEERIAWAYAVEHEDCIEVEELFVMPQFRRHRYGRALANAMGTLATRKSSSLRVWISHADSAPENLAIVEKLIHPLGLQVERSPERWASYVCAKPS